MTVHASVDQADVFAHYKQQPATPSPSSSIDHLPESIRQCFYLIDAMQRIVGGRPHLEPAEIGALAAKLTILRINLNVEYGVKTPQLS